jgi:hypothetical protein
MIPNLNLPLETNKHLNSKYGGQLVVGIVHGLHGINNLRTIFYDNQYGNCCYGNC